MVEICNRCQQRFTRAKHNTDYVHRCNSGDSTLDNEDILVLGSWSDYTGSGTKNKFEVMIGTHINEFQGTEEGIRGAEFDEVTDRGKRKSTHRTRQHLEYREFDINGK